MVASKADEHVGVSTTKFSDGMSLMGTCKGYMFATSVWALGSGMIALIMPLGIWGLRLGLADGLQGYNPGSMCQE